MVVVVVVVVWGGQGMWTIAAEVKGAGGDSIAGGSQNDGEVGDGDLVRGKWAGQCHC